MTFDPSRHQKKAFLIKAVANAIAHQRFEGKEPSQQVITDLGLVASGRLSLADALEHIKNQSGHVQILS